MTSERLNSLFVVSIGTHFETYARHIGSFSQGFRVNITKNIWKAPPTPLKFNMEPKNHPTEKENNLPNLYFQVPC